MLRNLDIVYVEFSRGVPVQDRKWRLLKVKSVFVGSEAIDWLLTNTDASTRGEALILCREFMKRSVNSFTPASHQAPVSSCVEGGFVIARTSARLRTGTTSTGCRVALMPRYRFKGLRFQSAITAQARIICC